MSSVAWADALDHLEQELERVEQAIAEGTVTSLPADTWTPPEVITRIPQHLVIRAVGLLHRQDAVVARLHEAVADMRSELTYVVSVDSEAHRPSRPAFLDAAL